MRAAVMAATLIVASASAAFAAPKSVVAKSSAHKPAASARCAPSALGTSRVIEINPREIGRVGIMQYSQYPQPPLKDHEVVLTFDDGPLPPYTDSVLKALAAECARATFFMVGRQANQFPDMVRRVYSEGHVIGTHSQNHPLTFDQMPREKTQAEIDDGIASVAAALGNPNAVAPFFRIPGLLRIADVEAYLGGKSIAVWSADVDADDWYRTATPQDVVQKAMARLNHRGRGVLLLHDVQPATALALPTLLKELKANNYRVVQVVPIGGRPPLHAVASRDSKAEAWPRVAKPNSAAENGPKPKHEAKRERRAAAPQRYSDWRILRDGLDGPNGPLRR